MSAKNSRDKAHEENMWGKPANDIINGIKNIRTVNPARGIWELVQNARDVVRPGERAEIEFTRCADSMTFQHDGIPFTWGTLEALILQTSSKSDTDAAQVGQYGTGFLTTHKFGLRFSLSAPLKLDDDAELYHNIVNFEIDRSATDKDGMRKAIKNQWNATEVWQNYDEQTTTPSRYTVFKYHCEHDVEQKNVKEAFLSSPNLIPYVLLLNDKISSITLNDKVEGSCTVFRRPSQEWNLEVKLNKGDVFSTKINEKEYFVIKSHDKAKKDNALERVVVILPIERIGEAWQAFTFCKDTPQLYINLPLLGTSNWGLNFLMHSPDFTCDTDKRDNLLLVGNGQNDDDQVADNKAIIKLGEELIFEFIDHYVNKLTNAKFLVRDNFKIRQSDDLLGEYYKQLRQEFRDKFKTLNIVSQGSSVPVPPSSIRVLDEKLTEACRDEEHGGKNLLNSIYKLLSFHNEIVRPLEADMLYWSETVGGWYKDEDNPQEITIDEVAKLISGTMICSDDTNWLFTICKYIIDIQRNDLFDAYALIPNEDNELNKLNPLLKPKSFPPVLKTALSLMVPEKVKLFIHQDFVSLFPDMVKYGDVEAKADLSAYISSHNDELAKQRENLKNKIINSEYSIDSDDKGFKPYMYSDDIVRSMIQLMEELLPSDSVSFYAKSLNLLLEFYGIAKSVNIEHLEKDVLDIRAFCTTLLHDAFFKFTLLGDKVSKAEWCRKMVENVYGSSDNKSMLSYYQVYPDKTGKFKYAESLKAQPDTMPDRVVELYEEITGKPLKSHLVSASYTSCFIGNGRLSINDTCGEIEKIVKDKGYNITDYDHQKEIVEIIQNLSSEDENGRKWRNMFGDIDAHKGQLMFSIIKSQSKRDSIFQIMKVDDDNRLKKIAELSKRENLDDLIRLGEEAIERERNEANDFAYKKELGEYVEQYLLERLGEKLGEIKVSIDDEQGGQDLIVSKDGKPIYYIEVKSRWTNNVSVLMSTLQYKRSIDNEDNYALVCVNMYDFDRSLVEKHEYPPLEKIMPRIRVIESIGHRNQGLIKKVNNESMDPHVNPGYQILVPQDLINSDAGESFQEFMDRLVEKFS